VAATKAASDPPILWASAGAPKVKTASATVAGGVNRAACSRLLPVVAKKPPAWTA
jgi:hypothetical protein